MSQLISFAQLARIKGVSKAAVAKAVKSGRISGAVVDLNGKPAVNQELALKLWGENTDPSVGGKRNEVGVIPIETKKELKKRVNALPEEAIPEFNVSKSRREHYQAELARLQVSQLKKELISTKDVEKSSFQMGRAVRESLSNLADRLSHQIAGESDATVIHRLLSDEHRNALEKLVEA